VIAIVISTSGSGIGFEFITVPVTGTIVGLVVVIAVPHASGTRVCRGRFGVIVSRRIGEVAGHFVPGAVLRIFERVDLSAG